MSQNEINLDLVRGRVNFALCLILKRITLTFLFCFLPKTHSSLTLWVVGLYCCLSCMLDPVPASIAFGWYLALFHQAYGETISVWLIIAALLYRILYHPAGLRDVCAVISNLWLLHLFRGSDHLHIAQCWMSNGVLSACRKCDHSSHLHLWNEFQVLQCVSVGSQQWTCICNKLNCSVLNITYCNGVAVSGVGAPLGASIWSGQAGSITVWVVCSFYMCSCYQVLAARLSKHFILNLPVVCSLRQYLPFLFLWDRFLCFFVNKAASEHHEECAATIFHHKNIMMALININKLCTQITNSCSIYLIHALTFLQ